MSRKSARKSAGRPFTGADDPRRGRGPKRGAPNAGRPPTEHIEWCQKVLADPAVEAAVKSVLSDPEHRSFPILWKAVADRAYGRPVQPVSGPNGELLPNSIYVHLVAPK